MSATSKVERFRSLKSLAAKLRKDLRGVRGRKKTAKRKGTTPVKGNDCVLLFAHNGVGKTRLSTEFKDIGKNGSGADTLYFNAFTEDLFDWDNDFEEDEERLIKFKSHSQFFYIDDPISSLDEHNTITLASDLASIIKGTKNGVKFVISTHHGLFFNVMFNELKGKRAPDDNIDIRRKAYILHRLKDTLSYTLQDTSESPFLHHVAALAELKTASKSGKISQHHFNLLRSILDKTAIFFGSHHISTCFTGLPKKALYARVLNVRSHAKYSVFEAEPIHAADKKMFREILAAFLGRYQFALPDVIAKKQIAKPAPVAGPISAAKGAPTAPAPAKPTGKTS